MAVRQRAADPSRSSPNCERRELRRWPMPPLVAGTPLALSPAAIYEQLDPARDDDGREVEIEVALPGSGVVVLRTAPPEAGDQGLRAFPRGRQISKGSM